MRLRSEWRRDELATLLMEQIITWAWSQRLVLHASEEGRARYEKVGFVQTNEMRFKNRMVF
jgi:GNAT superfamily N-acetyltransferase